MANLAFELGFDWDVPPFIGVSDGIFPLQVVLVNDGDLANPDDRFVISPSHPSNVRAGDTLRFRVYDFSASVPTVDPPSPTALQVLFTSATSNDTDPISPFEVNGVPQAQWASLDFFPTAGESVAFDVGSGWIAADAGPLTAATGRLTIERDGRFKFRALLTVGIPGEMARFYRVDPEMVIGPQGGE